MFSIKLSGKILNSRFEVKEELGSGGMAVVYAATDMELGRKVAIKVLHRFMLAEEQSRTRFEREAQMLSRLQHPGLPRVFSFGYLENDVPFIVIEFVEGISLESELKKNLKFDWRKSFQIAIQLADALQYVHENDIVHRDLKPANIMLLQDQSIKVLDFGLARALPSDASGNTITSTGSLIGSPQYMSPEQCRGMRCDNRADIYALACIVYEMISGQAPFQAEDFVKLIRLQEEGYAPLLKTRLKGQELPLGLDAIVFKALEKDPSRRFQSMREFADAMKSCLQGEALGFRAGSVTALAGGSKKKQFLSGLGLAALFLLAIIGFVSVKKSSNLAKVSVEKEYASPSLKYLDELDRLLISRNGSGLKSRFSKNQLERGTELIVRAIRTGDDSEATFKRESVSMERLVRSAVESTPIDQQAILEMQKRLVALQEIEHGKSNWLAEGKLYVFEGILGSVVFGNTCRAYCRAAVCFSRAGKKELSAQALNQARSIVVSDPEQARVNSIYIGIAQFVIDSTQMSSEGRQEAIRNLCKQMNGISRVAGYGAPGRAVLLEELAESCHNNSCLKEAEPLYRDAVMALYPHYTSFHGLKGFAAVEESLNKNLKAFDAYTVLRDQALTRMLGSEIQVCDAALARLQLKLTPEERRVIASRKEKIVDLEQLFSSRN